MSAKVAATDLRPGPSAPPVGPTRATLTLAFAEGRRLLRHPLVLVGMELSIYLYVRAIASGPMPVGPRADVQVAHSMLPLAVGTLLATNLAALRAHRHRTEVLYDTLPVGPTQRTAAHALSTAAPVGLAALAALVDLVLFWTVLGGVGSPNLFELAAAPAVVGLAGVLGVLLARLAPWFGVAHITVVGLAALWYLPFLLFQTTHQVWIRNSSWLFPWYATPGSPADWTNPFAGAWHLAYVAGLAAATASLAVGLLSVRRRLVLRTMATAVLVVVLATTGAIRWVPWEAVAQRRDLEQASAATGAPHTQECRTSGGARYCAWRAFLPWIDQWWKRPVDGVLRRLPPSERGRVVSVRQMELGEYARCFEPSQCGEEVQQAIAQAFADSDVRPSAAWPRDRQSQAKAELALAASVGAWAVGLTTAPRSNSTTLAVCMPTDARVVVALWLAGQSTPQAKASLEAATRGDPDHRQERRPRGRMTLRGGPTIPLWPWQEAAYAVMLLDRSADEVAARLHEDWQRWTVKGTPTEALVEAFGLPPLPTPAGEGAGPETAGRAHCEEEAVDAQS